LLFLYGVLPCLFLREPRLEKWRLIKRGALFGFFILLGVGIGSIQLFPAWDFAADSFRRKSSLAFCAEFSYAPESLFTLLCPNFFGLVPDIKWTEVYWGRNNWWEMCMYIGILPLIAAVVGVFSAPRRERWLLVICALVFFVLALGAYTPLFPLLYHCAPFFDTFRGTSKFSFMVLFCLVTLAGYGFERLFESGADGKTRRIAVWVGLVASVLLLLFVALVSVVLIPGHGEIGSHWQDLMYWRYAQEGLPGPDNWSLEDPAILTRTGNLAAKSLVRALGILTLTVGLFGMLMQRKPWGHCFFFPAVCVVLLLDSGSFVIPKLETFNPQTALFPQEFLEALPKRVEPVRLFDGSEGYSNLSMHHGFSSIGGYTGNTLLRYNNFVNRSQGKALTALQTSAKFEALHPVFRMLSLEYLALLPDEALPADMKVVARSKKGTLLVEYPQHSPRVFLATSPHACRKQQEAFDYIFDDKADLLGAPAIETPDSLPANEALTDGEKAEITVFSPNRVEVRVKASCSRVLVLDEMYEKNWVARINGKKTPIYPANYIFRGVIVPAGESTVVFSYESKAFENGLWVSIISLGIVLVFGGIVWGKRKKQGD
jgi:hypothetical protein